MDIHVKIDNDVNNLKEAMNKAEFVWLEWANDLTASLVDTPCKAKVMVRIHDHEIYQGRINFVNWNNVDAIWFINRDALQDFKKLIEVKCKMFFLPNAIEDEFTENIVDDYKIGFQSIFARPRKRIDRAIDVMRELKGTDWTLTVRADPAGFWEYYKPIVNSTEGLNVEWDMRRVDMGTYQEDKRDIDSFYADKSVVISPSEHEGFHYSIAEGMLCGCKPVVYNWEWGRAKDFWGKYVCNSVEEMAESIVNYKPSNSYRKFILDKFSPEALVPKLEKKIKQIC